MFQRALTGFVAGVMATVFIWSLLIPAMEQSSEMGRWSFLPAADGFRLGILFLLTTMLVLTFHNLPEGMAVGMVCAGWLSGAVESVLYGVYRVADYQLYGFLFVGYLSAAKNGTPYADSRHIWESGLPTWKLAEKACNSRTFPWLAICCCSAAVCGTGRNGNVVRTFYIRR